MSTYERYQMIRSRIIHLTLLCFVPLGCVTRYEANAILLDVPFCVQETDHCGCACLEMVMRYHGLSPDRTRIEQAVHVPVLGGSTAGLLAEAARDAGLRARVTEGSLADLKSWLAMKISPIIFLKYAKKDAKGHFIVVTGITECGKHVRIHSGRRANRWMDTDDLVRRWRTGRFKAIPIGHGADTGDEEGKGKIWRIPNDGKAEQDRNYDREQD